MDQSLTITEHRHVQECNRGPTRENSLKQQESLDLTSLQECALETTVSNFPPDLQKQIQKLQSQIIDISKRTAELYKVVNEKHLEAGMWEFRYLNRSVVFANVALACVLFAEGYISQLRPLFNRRDLKPNELYKYLEERLAISSTQGIVLGSYNAFPFLLSSFLFLRLKAYQRNLGFFLSTSYSLYLIMNKRMVVRANVTNILFNIAFLIMRYYRLHGLTQYKDGDHGFMI